MGCFLPSCPHEYVAECESASLLSIPEIQKVISDSETLKQRLD